MAIEVTCGDCGVTLSTPDSSAGRRTLCPKCEAIIAIPGPPGEDDTFQAPSTASEEPSEAATAPDETKQEEREPCPACGEMVVRGASQCNICDKILDESIANPLVSNDQRREWAWNNVRGGLANIYYGMVAIFFCVVAIMLKVAFSAAPRGRGEEVSLMIDLFVTLPLGLAIIAAGIVVFVGHVRCAGVPVSSGARGFAMGAIAGSVISAFVCMAGAAAESPVVYLFGSLFSMAGGFLFILFIRAIAIHLQNKDLVRSAETFLMLVFFQFVATFVLGLVRATAGGEAVGVVKALVFSIGLIVVATAIVAFVWYLRLLRSLMDSIDRRTEPS